MVDVTSHPSCTEGRMHRVPAAQSEYALQSTDAAVSYGFQLEIAVE